MEDNRHTEPQWALVVIGAVIALVGLLLAVTGIGGIWSRYDLVVATEEGFHIRLLGLFMLGAGFHTAIKAYRGGW